MKRFFKKISRSKLGQNILSFLGYVYIQLVYRTSRWDYKNRHIIEEYLKAGKPFMVCFWHGRLMMMPLAWQWDRPFKVLVSEHGDGTFIGKVVRYFKVGWVAGSTTRGGAKASLALIQLLRGGTIIGITPDGPRGPACKVSRGTAVLARWTQADLIPVTFSARNRRHLKTWDRFLLPLPFTRGVFAIGAPIPYAKEGEDSHTITALEEALNVLNAEADEWVRSVSDD
ncbi:lysophospholipid acyltransferase family protein [Candidatus Finniella inopinata]|uniref:DUF374 domain-containing protein n=1 Tax=Candidatus Finniella inopinata TaxID=1696036 RepID=A0A4V2DZX3_9PROT|nr:lysophospholipid acyltransferase family protein [Candidatus Finniella inopinata]RZI46557.1 DUF374 domain-containing protein [Candidatus Finniella inopinata]